MSPFLSSFWRLILFVWAVCLASVASADGGYMIVTTEAFRTASTQLNAFVTHKESRGFTVHVATEATWGGGTGYAAADNIRHYLQSVYETLALEYVLLIGDMDSESGTVPMVRIPDGEAFPVLTDYFFAELSSDWDTDDDGEIDDVRSPGPFAAAYDPDVHVGRIPMHSSTPVAWADALLRKTIDYEESASITWRSAVTVVSALLHYGYDYSEYVAELGEYILYRSPGDWNREWGRRLAALAEGMGYTCRKYNHGGEGVGWEDVADLDLSSSPSGLVVWSSWGRANAAVRRIWQDRNGDGSVHRSELSSAAFFDADVATGMDDSHPAIMIMASEASGDPEHADNIAVAALDNGAVAAVCVLDPVGHEGARAYHKREVAFEVARRLLLYPTTYTLGKALDDAKVEGARYGPDELLAPIGREAVVSMAIYGDPSLALGVQSNRAYDLETTAFNLRNDNLQVSGGRVRVDMVVRNNGLLPTPASSIRFVLSDTVGFDPSRPGDVYCYLHPDDPLYQAGDPTRLVLTGLEPGAERELRVLLAPPTVDPIDTDRRYFVGAVVDADHEIDEASELNNAGRELLVDYDDVHYFPVAPRPYAESFESGTLPDWWEVVPGREGERVEVTGDFEPTEGDYHVVMDGPVYWRPQQSELILHLDASSVSTREAFEPTTAVFDGREWGSSELTVDVSVDGGDTWLTGFSSDAARGRGSAARLLGPFPLGTPFTGIDVETFTDRSEHLIRFRHNGAAPLPTGGIAIDNIQAGSFLDEYYVAAFSIRTPNLQNHADGVVADFDLIDLITVAGEGRVGLRFFLSEDSHIDPATDIQLDLVSRTQPDEVQDTLYVDILQGLMSRGIHATISDTSVTLLVPETDPFGGGNRYYIGVITDPDNEHVEAREDNNSNRGIGLDIAEVFYYEPLTAPFAEDWEGADISDACVLLPGENGSVVRTGDLGAFEGTQHVVMQGEDGTDTLNQILLHLDLAETAELELSFANREWRDDNDPEDAVRMSIDQGRTWSLVVPLHDAASTEAYTRRRYPLPAAGSRTADTWITFQALSNNDVPTDGMAFDDIRIGPETTGPKVVRQYSPSVWLPGMDHIDVFFSEDMNTGSFDMADIVRFSGPDGTDFRAGIVSARWDSPVRLRIEFTALTAPGAYLLTLGPDIRDVNGNPMDQDADGTNGEPEDTFTVVFEFATAIFKADMDTDPGWTLDPGAAPYIWEYGRPTGGGSQGGGPSSGYDGLNVLGYHLAGDYRDGLVVPQYATTGAIDCSGHEHVALSFQRWLGVEGAAHDEAEIQASTDGTTWQNVWTNPEELLLDTGYTECVYDLSAIADGEATVYIRWGMGPTDSENAYCGWYLDNVLVTGIPIGTALPDISVTDSEGDPDDQAIGFGDTYIGSVSDVETVTIANTGPVGLAIGPVTVDDLRFSLTWDGDSSAPTVLAPGESRIVSITFAPDGAPTVDGILTIVSGDPDAAERRVEVMLSGGGVAAPTLGDHVFSLGSSLADAVLALSTGPDDSVISAGYFMGSMEVGSGSRTTYTSNGGRDIFVTKRSADGTHLWTWTAGGGLDDQATAVCTDGSGNVYVTGEFRQTVDFDPGAGVDQHSTAGNFPDVLVTKLAADGSYQWTRTVGGTASDAGYGIDALSAGPVAVTGAFRNTVDFDPGTGTHEESAVSGSDAFLLQLDTDGAFLGVQAFGSNRDDSGEAVTFDKDGNAIVVGAYRNDMDFDPGPTVDKPVHQGLADAFVTKFMANGDYGWTHAFGGADDDVARCVAIDAKAQVYVGGSFRGTVDFEGLNGNGETHTAAGIQDAFMLCLGADGSFGWVYVAGGDGTHYTDYDTCTAVAVGASSISMTGSFAQSADFGAGDPINARGGRDTFLVSLAPSGRVLRAESVGGVDDDDGYALALLASGSPVFGGTFTGSADLDPTDGEKFATSSGSTDLFITHLELNPGNTLAGTVWDDADGDGKRQGGETGISGWTVFLDLDQNGKLTAGDTSATTGTDGTYLFKDAPDGSYAVMAERQPGYGFTFPSGVVHTVTVADGQRRTGLDFGLWHVANSAPAPKNDMYSVPPGNALVVNAPGVLANDTDPDSNSLTASPASLPLKGHLTLNADGSFTYKANPEAEGVDTFTYTVGDDGQPPAMATATVTVRILTPGSYDYGDAPDPDYPTLASSGGAFHRIVDGVHLGATVDAEQDGIQTSDATGDDTDGTDDDDGIEFLTHLVIGQPAQVKVSASTPGYLDGWVDFNGDGDWNDVGERVFASSRLTGGDQTLNLTVPVEAAVGDTTARFRFSTKGGLGYSGQATDGEVEDYAVSVQGFSVYLRAGWNLVSPGYRSKRPNSRALPTVFWRWEPDSQRFVVVGPDEDLSPGIGYWVFAGSDMLLPLASTAERR